MEIYLIKMYCNNPSADHTLGIFTKDKIDEVKKKWKKIEKEDEKLEHPYYGKITLEVDKYVVNENL